MRPSTRERTRRRPGVAALLLLACLPLGGCKALRGRGASADDDAGPSPLAPKETAAAKTPPKPRPEPPLPPLPDLPVLEKQEPAVAVPPSVRSALGLDRNDTGGCGGLTWDGERLVSLPCLGKGGLFGRAAKGAVALVSPKLLDAAPGSRPRVVDHRFSKLEGPVRDQRTSPACTAFALAGAVDQAVARFTGKASNVSALEIWSRYKTPFAERAIAENIGHTLGSESLWPFDERTAKGWLPCPPSGKPPKEGCGLTPDPKRLASLAAAPIATFTDVTYLDDPDIDVIESHLAIGEDVIVTVDLPEAFAPRGRAGARYVPHWTVPKIEGGHAMLLAGYAVLGKAKYFLIHNSWGTRWGDGGYAWIHATTLEKHLREALVVDAEPVLRDAAKKPRVRGAFTCDPPLVPDSMRGTCAPLCPDGSPRSDGVCPVASHCPAGQVNLTGVCVVAAPRARGTDESSGISWQCGPGGCTYELPRKVAPDCPGRSCKTSCPAPVFRVARAGDDLTCVR